MADRSLRGMRLGAQSLQSEEGVVFSPRTTYTYRCATCGRDTDMVFSAEAEAPETWECKYCSHEATLMVGSEPVEVDHGDVKRPVVTGTCCSNAARARNSRSCSKSDSSTSGHVAERRRSAPETRRGRAPVTIRNVAWPSPAEATFSSLRPPPAR